MIKNITTEIFSPWKALVHLINKHRKTVDTIQQCLFWMCEFEMQIFCAKIFKFNPTVIFKMPTKLNCENKGRHNAIFKWILLKWILHKNFGI